MCQLCQLAITGAHLCPTPNRSVLSPTMLTPATNGHCLLGRSGRSRDWPVVVLSWMCCAALLVAITCLVTSFNLHQRILTLESNCDKYQTLINRVITNSHLFSDNAINDINGSEEERRDRIPTSQGTDIGDTLQHLIDHSYINAIIEEVFIAYCICQTVIEAK